MKKLLLIAAVGLGAFLSFHFFSRPAFTNFPPDRGTTWIAYGDSLTSGEGASDGHSYPALLSQRIGVDILNRGIPGNTTEGGLNGIDDVTRLNPKVVLLCLGGNDGLQAVPAQQMFGNLRLIIDRLHQAGAFVVLIGVRSASLLDKNEAGFKALAKDMKLLYVPNILSGLIGDPSLMADQVHPNDQGYAVIAARLESALQPVMSKLLP
jgi:acyl-CoA thioesterase I